MSSFKEKNWWIFPIWRTLVYSLCMGVIWALPIAILGAVVSQRSYSSEKSYPHIAPNPSDFDNPNFPDWLIYVALTVGLSMVLMILGAIPGLFAGVNAPVSEPLNPFKSKFFILVSKQSFRFLLLSTVFFYFNMVLFSSLLHQRFIPYDEDGSIFWLVGSVLGYIFGIRQALTNAYKQSKQTPKID